MKTQQVTHTPTPWKVSEVENFRIDPLDQTQLPIAKILIQDGKTLREKVDNRLAAAAFIVRAVNSHEELVEDLAICLQSFGKDMQGDFRRRVEAHLKQAIAKVEGLS